MSDEPWHRVLAAVGDSWTYQSDIAAEAGIGTARAHELLLKWQREGRVELRHGHPDEGNRAWVARRVPQ